MFKKFNSVTYKNNDHKAKMTVKKYFLKVWGIKLYVRKEDGGPDLYFKDDEGNNRFVEVERQKGWTSKIWPFQHFNIWERKKHLFDTGWVYSATVNADGSAIALISGPDLQRELARLSKVENRNSIVAEGEYCYKIPAKYVSVREIPKA